jgi:hypothetical protein
VGFSQCGRPRRQPLTALGDRSSGAKVRVRIELKPPPSVLVLPEKR